MAALRVQFDITNAFMLVGAGKYLPPPPPPPSVDVLETLRSGSGSVGTTTSNENDNGKSTKMPTAKEPLVPPQMRPPDRTAPVHAPPRPPIPDPVSFRNERNYVGQSNSGSVTDDEREYQEFLEFQRFKQWKRQMQQQPPLRTQQQDERSQISEQQVKADGEIGMATTRADPTEHQSEEYKQALKQRIQELQAALERL